MHIQKSDQSFCGTLSSAEGPHLMHQPEIKISPMLKPQKSAQSEKICVLAHADCLWTSASPSHLTLSLKYKHLMLPLGKHLSSDLGGLFAYI